MGLIPDYDNFQKWLNWFKEKPIYKLWLILPIILLLIVGWQYKTINELNKIKEEVTPIKELYPKLELSAAVAKILEDYKTIEKEIQRLKQKEEQKVFKPLSSKRQNQIILEIQELKKKYPDTNFLMKLPAAETAGYLVQLAIFFKL